MLIKHQLRKDVDRHREDDGAVVLRRDVVQRLQVAQLKRKFAGTASMKDKDDDGGGLNGGDESGDDDGDGDVFLGLQAVWLRKQY